MPISWHLPAILDILLLYMSQLRGILFSGTPCIFPETYFRTSRAERWSGRRASSCHRSRSADGLVALDGNTDSSADAPRPF